MIWPIHPQPQESELLSSWMVRLAHGNCYKTHDFYCQYFGRERQIWNRDIDHHAPEWLLRGLSNYSGLSIERLEQMCLRSYEGLVFESFADMSVTRGMLALAVYHRRRQIYGQQFCPLCLLESETPYLRKEWRVATICVCHIHQVVLRDRCEHCQAPMMQYRSDMHTRHGFPRDTDIERCSVCRKLFTGNHSTVIDPDLSELQNKIYDCIRTGVAFVAERPLYSFIFLEGIRTMMQGVARIEKIKERVQAQKIVLETSEIELRLQLLTQCAKLIKSWPVNFAEYLKTSKQPYSNIVSRNTDGSAPYWIEQVIKDAL